jgi:hypothetical protein
VAVFVRTIYYGHGKFLHIALLSSEAMKNTPENSAWMNLVERLAISFGIDAPRHCFPRFIANQADRKLVGTLAGNDGGTHDPTNDDGGWRPNWV